MPNPLPDDPLNRYWLSAEYLERPVELIANLATIVAIHPDDGIRVIGNAFVISSHGHQFIGLTAAHNFDEIKKWASNRTINENNSLPPDFRRRGNTYITVDNIRVSIINGGQPCLLSIRQIEYIENYDIALFTAHASSLDVKFEQQLGIDLTPLAVGDEVAVIANSFDAASDEQGHIEVRQKLNMRLGTVTKVNLERGRLGQTFTFDMTVPVDGGMSGAPIVKKPKMGEKVIALGVVTSDFSPPEAFTNFDIPGHSMGTLIWPALGFQVQCNIEGVERYYYLEELVKRKIIEVFSPNIDTELNEVDNKMLLHLIDRRQVPHSRWTLETDKPVRPKNIG